MRCCRREERGDGQIPAERHLQAHGWWNRRPHMEAAGTGVLPSLLETWEERLQDLRLRLRREPTQEELLAVWNGMAVGDTLGTPLGHPSVLGHPEWDTLAADGLSGHPRFHAGGTPSLYTSPGTLPHSFLHLFRPSLLWDTLGLDPSKHPLRSVPFGLGLFRCLDHQLCEWDTPSPLATAKQSEIL